MGNGPSSLVFIDKLNKAYGHSVVVYECVDQIGGETMYGVPNMKSKLDVIK